MNSRTILLLRVGRVFVQGGVLHRYWEWSLPEAVTLKIMGRKFHTWGSLVCQLSIRRRWTIMCQICQWIGYNLLRSVLLINVSHWGQLRWLFFYWLMSTMCIRSYKFSWLLWWITVNVKAWVYKWGTVGIFLGWLEERVCTHITVWVTRKRSFWYLQMDIVVKKWECVIEGLWECFRERWK